MAVKILIKRSVAANKVGDLIPLLKSLRALAIREPDYISGETLKRMDIPGEYMVISTWESLDAWNRWLQNGERKLIQDKIDLLLGQKTKYAVYLYG